MESQERAELIRLVREALARTYRMRTPDGELGGVLPLIETQLAWCLQQLRMAEEPALPEGKTMNMGLAALREYDSSFGGPDDDYAALIGEIERRFTRAVDG